MNICGNRLAVLNGKPGCRRLRFAVWVHAHGAVSSHKDLGVIRCLQKGVDLHPAAFAEQKPCLFKYGIGPDTAGPENGSGINGRAVRELDRVVLG